MKHSLGLSLFSAYSSLLLIFSAYKNYLVTTISSSNFNFLDSVNWKL
jgi:hypothetical protein